MSRFICIVLFTFSTICCRADLDDYSQGIDNTLRVEVVYNRQSYKTKKYEVIYSDNCWIFRFQEPVSVISNGGSVIVWADTGDMLKCIYYADIIENSYHHREEVKSVIHVLSSITWYP